MNDISNKKELSPKQCEELLNEPQFMVSKSFLRVGYAAQVEGIFSSERRGDSVEFFMTKMVGVPAGMVAGMRKSPMWHALEGVAHTLAYDLTIMGDFSVPAGRMAAVTVPTLFMDGGASPTWAYDSVQALMEILPNTQRSTPKGQTHDVNTDVLAPVLLEFSKEKGSI